MDNTADDREEELSSLTAIFPEIEISDSDRFSFSLDIPVTPAEPPQVRFSSSKHVITLSHLPHLRLDMTLPVDYPTKQAPIIKLSSNPAWVPGAKLGELRDQATDLWEQYGRSQMAFDFIDSLQQAAERVFDLAAGSDNVLDLDGSMQQVIIKFNKEAAKKVFDAETFDCGVCLDPKKGLDCHKLHKCGHVFCLECLRSAYDAAIVEGDVSSVKCLFPDCGVERDTTTKRATKAAPTLGPDELLDVPIALAAVERYVKLKRKKRFESFPKTVYCPRKWCQGIARHKRFPKKAIESMTAEDLEPEVILAEADAEPKDLRNNQDRLRICEDCDLAFCRVCLATWHGEYVTRCWPRTADELTEEEKASYSYLLKYVLSSPSHEIVWELRRCRSYVDLSGSKFQLLNSRRASKNSYTILDLSFANLAVQVHIAMPFLRFRNSEINGMQPHYMLQLQTALLLPLFVVAGSE
jgi:E3 ubiquitin-protein ligase RNF14